jgi:hypothetical protein
MKKWMQCLLAVGLVLNGASAMAACSPIPGAEQAWSKPALRWVFVGELHGSNETPEEFLNLVCDALARGRQVTVALERPTSEQAALDGILNATDSPAATRRLLSEPGWVNGMDGRASEAMLRLLIALRALRRSYPDLAVAAFDAPYSGNAPGARDEVMGHALLAVGSAAPKNLILVLTGNIHAMQAPVFGYDLAAMFLPAGQRLSLEVTDRGGESWTDNVGGCGAWKGGIRDKDITRPRGIFFDPSLAPYGKVDGILSLGVPLTASAPAAGEPSPLPACRIKFLQQKH